MTGIEGRARMTRIMDQLRANPPASIAGKTVTTFEDFRDENGRLGRLVVVLQLLRSGVDK